MSILNRTYRAIERYQRCKYYSNYTTDSVLEIIACAKLLKETNLVSKSLFNNQTSAVKSYFLCEDFEFYKNYIDLEKIKAEDIERILCFSPVAIKQLAIELIPKRTISRIVSKEPGICDSSNKDIILRKVDFCAFSEIVKHCRSYEKEFLNYIKYFNPTDTRKVLTKYPSLIKSLVVKHLENSTLTAKEWLLHIDRIARFSKRDLKFSDECFEYLKMEYDMEVLSGNSEHSNLVANVKKRLSDAKNQ